MTTAAAKTGVRYDDQLLEILVQPRGADETHTEAFARKEVEFCAVVEQLPLADARGLLRRLSIAKLGDALVEPFGRLTADRRARLIAFVADAPRRAVLASISKTPLR